jgi:anti-sigma factor RsiW
MKNVISCQQLIDYCLDYIEGDLPDDEQVRFRRHLVQCPDCVTFFETYRRTPDISRTVLGTEMPETVKESVWTFLRARREG